MKLDTEVLVIGGGLTGAGILRDLALRGVSGVLVERKDINAGASGANHGLLHSGARYAVRDPESAAECVRENRVLKRVAAGCIDDTGGLFVALPDDDEEYVEELLSAAKAIDLPARLRDVKEVLEAEPLVNREIVAAVEVPDASINPFLATLANLSDAERRGSRVLLHHEVTGLTRKGDRIVAVECLDRRRGKAVTIVPRQVVSAAGPWVDRIGAMAGAELPIAYSKGSLLISNSRLVNHVINRLRPPSDGDIVVPGESVTITGTNSIRVKRLDHLGTSADEVEALIEQARALVPAMGEARIIRAYAGVRPLVGNSDGSDRNISRTFSVFDHEEHGLSNLTTIAGGKLTTFRLMAERVCDLVTRRLGLERECTTDQVPLPCGPEQDQRADQPGLSAAHRLGGLAAEPPDGAVVCECEMVGKERMLDLVRQLQEAGLPADLTALRLRSRLGMGSCQGGFCGFRTVAALYEAGVLQSTTGNEMLMTFLERRWSGIKPVLWGDQLRQEQLLEAIYCGTLNIDGNL